MHSLSIFLCFAFSLNLLTVPYELVAGFLRSHNSTFVKRQYISLSIFCTHFITIISFTMKFIIRRSSVLVGISFIIDSSPSCFSYSCFAERLSLLISCLYIFFYSLLVHFFSSCISYIHAYTLLPILCIFHLNPTFPLSPASYRILNQPFGRDEDIILFSRGRRVHTLTSPTLLPSQHYMCPQCSLQRHRHACASVASM